MVKIRILLQELTCTIAEQNPATKADAKIISTLNANKVNAQDIDRGIETNMSVFRRPCLMIKLEHKPPNKAPKRDKLAIHDPCCCVILMLGRAEENVGI